MSHLSWSRSHWLPETPPDEDGPICHKCERPLSNRVGPYSPLDAEACEDCGTECWRVLADGVDDPQCDTYDTEEEAASLAAELLADNDPDAPIAYTVRLVYAHLDLDSVFPCDEREMGY